MLEVKSLRSDYLPSWSDSAFEGECARAQGRPAWFSYKLQVRDIWYLASGIRHLVSGIWYLASVSGIWHLASGIWHLASGIWHLASGISYLVPGAWQAPVIVLPCLYALLQQVNHTGRGS